MNPCWKLSLFEGARYVAIADFIYATLSITVIALQFINSSQHGVPIMGKNIPLADTGIKEVLIAYLVISFINLILSILIYKGITTDSLGKCRAFLGISIFSTICGIGTVLYHGFHLAELSMSLIFSEFVLSFAYHLYKVYALTVIFSFTRELDKLLHSEDATKTSRRHQYQTLDSTNRDDSGAEVAKHIVFNIPFSARQYIPPEKFTTDHEACIEYDDTTSTMKGVLFQAHGNFKRAVAVKMLKSNFRTEKHMIALTKEAKLLAYIGHHEHILQFFGVCCTSTDVTRGNVMLILESFPARRLDDFLRSSFDNELQNFENLLQNDNSVQSKRQAYNEASHHSKRLGTLYENYATNYFNLESFSTVNMIQWAYQVSSAMEYLHSKKIVLGNLQAKSVVLVKVSRVKLTNFALASELFEGNNLVTSVYLTGKISWRWTAMECLIAANKGLPTEFNEKTDIWSFGSMLWEIFSMGNAPNNMSSCLTEYIGDLTNGKRPERPQFASKGIYNFIITCWNDNPSKRPSFNIVTLFFRQLLSHSIEGLN